MSKKQIINCLTLLFCCSPLFIQAEHVNFIINSFLELETTTSYDVHIHQVAFEENLDNEQIIVLDAGHGGHDPGTSGKNSKEKDIALAITKKLGQYINSVNANIKVIYTRDKDVFIPLHKRIDIANKSKADLFVSIHCNYVGNPKICGTETFVMGLHRAEENLNVAKRENSSVLLESEYQSNYDGYDPNSPVGHILLSMFQNVFLDNSIKLASNIETNFTNRKKTKSRGVKQAGFVVLRQATMPSVLVESGFLSNAKEEKYLMSKTGQQDIAKSVGNGVLDFLKPTVFVQSHKAIEEKPRNKTPEKTQKIEGKYVVQIGVFSNRKDAKFEKLLTNFGEVVVQNTGKVYKYSVGFYPSQKDAEVIASSLRLQGFTDAYIKLTD